MVDINKKVVTCFAATLFVQVLLHTMETSAQLWEVAYFFSRLEISIWLFLLFVLIPYQHLFAKTLIFTLFLAEISSILIFFIDPNMYLLYGLRSLIFISGIFYLWFKSYSSEIEELDEEHFFIVGIKPKNIRSFLLSLYKDPVGGIGVYAQGKFYHYQRDKLRIDNKEYIQKRPSKYRIIKKDKITLEQLHQLNQIKGSKREKWSLKYNCITVLEPIISKKGRPYA